jgi:hypothetical protein
MTEREPNPPDRADDEDPRVREAEDAAAREAGAIGGDNPDEGIPEADRPLAEAGQGESEGFERAEEDLVEHASHGDSGPDPTHMAGEAEQAQVAQEHAEADDVRASELDPDERSG